MATGADSSSIALDVRRLTEAFIKFSVRMDEQYKAIAENIQKLDDRFCQIERANNEHDKRLAYNTQRLDTVEEHIKKLEPAVSQMEPWVSGVRWAMMIAGSVLVLVIIGAVLWAIVQNGAQTP